MNRKAQSVVSQRVISLLLLLTLSPLQAHAWQMRGGAGARTSVAPHRSFSNAAAPRPMSAPAPHSQPTGHPSGQGPQSGAHPSGQGSQSGSHPSGQGQPPQHQQGNGSQPPPSNNNQSHNDSHHDDGHHDDSHGNDDHHDDGHHDDGHHDDDHHDDGHHHDDDDWYHPWATAAVVGATTATAIAIGTAVRTVPTSCVPVLINGVSFRQCGSTWYQPQYVGTSLQYIVVVAPR